MAPAATATEPGTRGRSFRRERRIRMHDAEARSGQRQQAATRDLLVQPQEYLALAVSRKKLQRSDVPGFRGLFDPASGARYLVREEQLLEHFRQDFAGRA